MVPRLGTWVVGVMRGAGRLGGRVVVKFAVYKMPLARCLVLCFFSGSSTSIGRIVGY